MMRMVDQNVLVLNRSWAAVNVCSVARALVLLWNDNARVVDVNDYQTFTWEDWAKIDPQDGDKFIQTTSLRLRVPEVITLTSYDKLPETAVTFSRRNIFKRDHYVCQYCGEQPGMDDCTIDHVIPRSRSDGKSSWDNCVLACTKCNKRKANRTPQEAGMTLRKQPVKPSWRPVYAIRNLKPESWRKFISDVYWNVELQS